MKGFLSLVQIPLYAKCNKNYSPHIPHFAQQHFTCVGNWVSLVQILPDLEHTDCSSEMCLFPGYEVLVEDPSASCYVESVGFRISPDTGVWRLKLVCVLCCWRPSVEPQCPCEYNTRQSQVTGTSSCEQDALTLCFALGESLVCVPHLAEEG